MRARTPAFSPNTTASSKQTQRGCLAQAYLKIRIPEIGGEVPQLWRTEILGATEVTSQRSRRGPDTPPRLSPSVSLVVGIEAAAADSGRRFAGSLVSREGRGSSSPSISAAPVLRDRSRSAMQGGSNNQASKTASARERCACGKNAIDSV